MKPCKILAHSDKHSDNIFLWWIKVVWMSWNFVRFHKIKNQKDAENFRFLSWQTKKCTSLQMAPWRPNFPHQRLCSRLHVFQFQSLSLCTKRPQYFRADIKLIIDVEDILWDLLILWNCLAKSKLNKIKVRIQKKICSTFL